MWFLFLDIKTSIATSIYNRFLCKIAFYDGLNKILQDFDISRPCNNYNIHFENKNMDWFHMLSSDIQYILVFVTVAWWHACYRWAMWTECTALFLPSAPRVVSVPVALMSAINQSGYAKEMGHITVLLLCKPQTSLLSSLRIHITHAL